ncbi:uncharacterized protein F4822DRAFT_434160 [Hypoxylon trugodes]|uniref:uncharacterized protein n=1 Tax=Hypoxylon trugodes TaxID=326681 RepID=UPI00219690D1|nr:uncharacterized protein F4822DRAFT_434160 [Hypoxylon trugodes]KAI1384221.1 hypothetical protein F4822DRAFT_434160 [Hypoxylon trugodes]
MAPLNQVTGQDFGDALQGPALQPPSGITPNFDNPPNRNVYAYAALIFGISLSSIFGLLRVYARLFYIKRVHIADLLGVAAFGTYVGATYSLFSILNACGYFVHQWNMHVKDLLVFNKAYMFYCATVLTIKSAIVIEWMFIFVPKFTRNAFFWTRQVLLWINILFYIAMVILPNVACHPHEKLWNPLLPGKCIDTTFSGTLVSAFNFTVDILLFVLPQKVIWGLQMSTKKKLGFSLIFIIGILACISAGFKVAASIPYNSSRDTTYTFAALSLWSFAEITCGILVFCMPFIPKVLAELELAKLASTLQSWAGSSTEKLKRSKSRDPIQSESNTDTSPKISGSNAYDFTSHDSGNDVSHSSTKQDSASLDDNRAAIIRTTQFTADEIYGPQDRSNELKRQHPWII